MSTPIGDLYGCIVPTKAAHTDVQDWPNTFSYGKTTTLYIEGLGGWKGIGYADRAALLSLLTW